MIIVSNASPLLALDIIGSLDVLPRLYHQIHIPPRVAQETALTAPWLVVQPVADQPQVAVLRQNLDAGESEAIALALQLQADRLLIDERRGRALAHRYGIRVTGVLGVLLVAKKQGTIAQVRPFLEALRATGFWFDDALYHHILHTAGEAG